MLHQNNSSVLSPMKPKQLSSKTSQAAQLSALRKRIDRLDRQLLRSLSHRADLALKVGSVKKEYDLPIFDRKREDVVIKKAVSGNDGPLKGAAIEKIFREILRQVRQCEESAHQ